MEYKKYLETKKLKKSTIKIYLWHINKFLFWLNKEKINNKNLNKYYYYLLKKYKKIASININLSILNNYLKYKKIKYPFNLLTIEERQINILNDKQLREFLNKPLKEKYLIKLRNKVLLELLYSTGLKVKQISELKINNIDCIKNEIIINKKIISLTPTSWYYLEKYLKYRKDNNPYLFISLDKANKSKIRINKINHLSIRSIERILEKYSKNFIPVLKITPEILRNTFAYNIKKNGGEVKIIKNMLHFKSEAGAKKYFEKL